MKLFKRKPKITDYHTIDYIKTDEELDAYVKAYTEELQEENKRFMDALRKIAKGTNLKKSDLIDAARLALNPSYSKEQV